MNPAMTLLNASPFFMVRDLMATARWYRDLLGFQFSTWGEPAEFAIAFRDGVEIMLRQPKDPFVPRSNRTLEPTSLDAYLRVDDVDALHAELVKRGASVRQEPVTRFYKMREIEVMDPDGYLLCFAQDVA
jgi:catechol 2,3-dioxygenase-like lactoylglutathione lyase family enzyme